MFLLVGFKLVSAQMHCDEGLNRELKILSHSATGLEGMVDVAGHETERIQVVPEWDKGGVL